VIEIQDINRHSIGALFFENRDLYISFTGALPIVYRNAPDDVIEQLGIFLQYYGKDPETAAVRIDFFMSRQTNEKISFRIQEMTLWVVTDKMTHRFEGVPLGQFKKLGLYLKRARK
jgi:hypothetical protein